MEEGNKMFLKTGDGMTIRSNASHYKDGTAPVNSKRWEKAKREVVGRNFARRHRGWRGGCWSSGAYGGQHSRNGG